MHKHILTVSKREVIGKKVKTLRKEGLIPANVYGKGIEPLAVQLRLTDFESTYKQTGASGLVELHVGTEVRPVLIHEIQRDYLTQAITHADFYQVNLKEKVKTMIPVVLIGEAAAIAEKVGIVLQTLNEVEVEALPADLPEKFELDVSALIAVDEQLTVADLVKMTGVEMITGAGEMIVKIAPLVSAEAVEQAAEEATASEEAKVEGAEETKDGEAKTAETPKEETKE